MATTGGSIAAMGATSITATTGRIRMDSNLFASEVNYQISLSIAETLLRSELLTDGEFARARNLLLETYRPPIGILFAEVG
jgi:hypothetical protein